MSIVVTDMDGLIVGKKLSFAYQFTTGGKEYLVCAYYHFGRESCVPIFIVFNLTDDTVIKITATGCDGGECYPVDYKVDLLDNGCLATVNRTHYFEINLSTGTLFSKALRVNPNASNSVCQGLTGHVIIAEGTEGVNSHIEWCDPGGGNWDGLQLTLFTGNGELYGPGAMLATDGDNYAYCYQYGTNLAIGVNMRTKAETLFTFTGRAHIMLHQTTDNGNKIYGFGTTPNTYYKMDGALAPEVIENPASNYHYQYESGTITANWFTAAAISVDATNIMPNDSDIVSITYDGKTKSSTVDRYAMEVKTFSPPHPDGFSLIQGSDYGPVNKFIALNNSIEFIGYQNPTSNSYGEKWNPNHQTWDQVGYDKLVNIYNPVLPWSLTPMIARSSLNNPSYRAPDVGLSLSSSDDHFLFPITEAIDKKRYFSCRSRGKMIWYDSIADTWGLIDLVTGNKINDGVTTNILPPLYDCDIVHMCSVMGGHFIVISSADKDTAEGEWIGRLRLFHVPSQNITKVFTTVTGITDFGAICEVQELVSGELKYTSACIGHIIAVRGNLATGCRAWRINTYEEGESAVKWNVAITGNAFGIVTGGMQATYADSSHIEIAPDGLIYLYIDSDIYSLNPSNGTLIKIIDHAGNPAAPPVGNLRWIGNKLYRSGFDTHIYEIVGLI
jgi:hypothetical protein